MCTLDRILKSEKVVRVDETNRAVYVVDNFSESHNELYFELKDYM